MDIFPMGAKQAKDKFELLMENDLYIAQEKIDGVRALIHLYKGGVVKVTTRGASVDAPDTPIDITHRIPYINDWQPPNELLGCIIDTEITIPGLDSAQVAGIVSYKSQVEIPNGIQFNAFDIIAYDNKTVFSWNQQQRLHGLSIKSRYFPEWLIPLPIYFGTEAKYDLLDEIFSCGKEGIMLKNLNSMYIPGKKPAHTWYKVKKVDSIDAKIVGSCSPEKYYRDPKTNEEDTTRLTKLYENGWFGAIIYELEDGTRGTVSGFSDEERAKMSENHQVKPCYLGRWMELKFMEKTKDGKLRHPRFIRLREEVEK